ncbi:MAG: hypothetical protein DWI10_06670 [Planctomycetota bacterium]|nr:MAG: hypothetical protein DWI10_06670 [Planctomycetota bacterium]
MSITVRGLIRDRWMFAPALLLTGTVTLGTVTVLCAVVGHPLGAEPAYDTRAVAWQAQREQRAINEQLRWVITLQVSDVDGSRALSMRIEDKHGVRIHADRVRVECIPIRAAEARVTVELSTVAEGEYAGTFDSPIGGQWEFRVEVMQNAVLYSESVRRFLSAGTGNGDSRHDEMSEVRHGG